MRKCSLPSVALSLGLYVTQCFVTLRNRLIFLIFFISCFQPARSACGASVVFTNAVTIAFTNTLYEGFDIAAQACAVTINGSHSFGKLSVVSNGTLRLSETVLTNAGQAITADGGTVVIDSSTIHGGVLTVTSNASSVVQFAGNVILNGVRWEDTGAGEFQAVGSSTRLLGDYAYGLPAGYTLVVRGNLYLVGGSFTNSGVIDLRYYYSNLYLETNTTLSGNGQVRIRDYSLIRGAGGAALTVGPDQWVHGYGGADVPVINQGLIEADVSGHTLNLTTGLVNQGMIRVSSNAIMSISGLTDHGLRQVDDGATLSLGGSISVDVDLTAVTGRVLRLSEVVLTNAGQAVTADGGTVVIDSSTIHGGVLRVTSNTNSVVQFAGNVTLNGVRWEDTGAGEFQAVGSSTRLLGDYAYGLPAGYTLVVRGNLYLVGGSFTNSGVIDLRYYHSNLYLETNTTLSGNGQVRIKDYSAIRGAKGAVLTVGPNQWIHGCGGTDVPVINQGLIEADVSGNTLYLTAGVTNEGTIRVSTNATMSISGLTDHGLRQVDDDATLELDGSVSVDVGLTAVTGRVLRLSEVALTNAGQAVTADGGTVVIDSSTIHGGVLRVTSNTNSVIQFVGNVTLNGVLWEDTGAGEFQVVGSPTRLLGDYAHGLPAGYTLVVKGNLYLGEGVFKNSGVIELRYYHSNLYLETNTTLSGNGQVRMKDDVGDPKGQWSRVDGSSKSADSWVKAD